MVARQVGSPSPRDFAIFSRGPGYMEASAREENSEVYRKREARDINIWELA